MEIHLFQQEIHLQMVDSGFPITMCYFTRGFPSNFPNTKKIPSFGRLLQFTPEADLLAAGGWTNPIEKYARQIGKIFPKVRGAQLKNTWKKPPPSI